MGEEYACQLPFVKTLHVQALVATQAGTPMFEKDASQHNVRPHPLFVHGRQSV